LDEGALLEAQIGEGEPVAGRLFPRAPSPEPEMAPPANPSSDQLERLGALLSAASSAGGESLIQRGANLGLQKISAQIAAKLAPQGNSRVSLAVGPNFALTAAADFLYPFHDGEKVTAFVQTGARYRGNSAFIAHLGLGTRFFSAPEMGFGLNIFGDWDLIRRHARLGGGLELFYKLLRLSSNLYYPISHWKESRDYPGALERPARGFDLRARGYWPWSDKLSFSLAYENFRGAHVGGAGLFDQPEAGAARSNGVWALGARFTPTPTVSFEYTERIGKIEKGREVAVFFNPLRLGTESQNKGPLPVESRFDFVERRYDMPLDYRAEKLYVISLARREGNVYYFRVTNSLNVPWKDEKVLLRAETSGFAIRHPELNHLQSVFATDGDGLISVLFVPAPGVTAGTVSVSAGDAQKSFPLTFTAEPASPPPTQEEGYRVIYIGPEGQNVHVFRVVDLNDLPAANVSVAFNTQSPGIPVADPEGDAPREIFVSDGEGYIRIKLLPGDLSESEVTIVATPPVGEEGEFTVPLLYALSLKASPLSLEYLAAQEVDFSLELNGEPLAAGLVTSFHAANGDFAGLPESAVSAPGGKIKASGLTALKGGSLSPVRAKVGGEYSNGVTFTASALGNFTLEANRDSLEFLTPTEIVFSFSYKGVALPAGVSVTFKAAEGDFTGLPANAVTGAGGKVAVAGLVALKPTGPLSIGGQVGGRDANDVSLAVSAVGSLSLATTEPYLDFLSGARRVFTLRYNGYPLPEGLAATFAHDPARLQGLVGALTVASGGAVTADSLKALTPKGPITLTASVGSLVSNPLDLEVRVHGFALSMEMELIPAPVLDDPGLGNGLVIKPCVNYAATMTFKYLGELLRDAPLQISGLGLSVPGEISGSDGWGSIAGNIFFDRTDQTGYLSDPYYHALLGDADIPLLGPYPQSFKECQ
jgi:hypothetical protein